MSTDEEDDKIEVVSGYIHTHADCPYCYEPGEYEGDCGGETLRCTACDKEFQIGTVR